ncbi:MAG: MBL fold metallo-hydrolase, partial [Chloroflexota bacterium]|nr:MBL fold metallo-hydrolase [Chloroflexota bacterium]
MIRLLGEFWVVSGDKLTHAWDASAYLIAGDEPTLIDCGSAKGYPALKRDLKTFGYEPRDISRVLATHGHWDHLSAMAQLKQESDAKLYIHEAEQSQVESGDALRTATLLYDRQFPPVKVDGYLYDGDILRVNGFELQVIHTPGHSPGSVSFWTQFNGVK